MITASNIVNLLNKNTFKPNDFNILNFMILISFPRDPNYIIPLVKSLLNKRRTKLRRKGRLVEANLLADKINSIIADIRNNNLKNLEKTSVKELWAAVNYASKPSSTTANCILGSPDSVNLHLSKISYDANVSSIELFKDTCTIPINRLADSRLTLLKVVMLHKNTLIKSVTNVQVVERMLSSFKKTAAELDNILTGFSKNARLKLLKLLVILFIVLCLPVRCLLSGRRLSLHLFLKSPMLLTLLYTDPISVHSCFFITCC